MKKKTPVMIFSLLAAFLLWAYVITYVNPVIDQAISGIPIQVLNADSLYSQGLVLTGVSHVSTTVTISGNRSDVSAVTADDILATLDVSGYGAGENVIRIDVTCPSTVTIKDIKNSGKVTATIDNYVTETKPYEFLYSGSIPEGYELGEMNLEPSSISVTGAKTMVDQVKSIRAVLDLSKVTKEGYAFTSAVSPTSEDSKEVKDVSLSATTLNGTAFLYQVETLPLTVTAAEEIPEGYTLLTEPEDLLIKVRSRTADFTALEAIETEPLDISLWTSAISNGEDLPDALEVTLVPVLPEGVELASGEEVPAIQFSLIKMEAETESGEETADPDRKDDTDTGDSGEKTE